MNGRTFARVALGLVLVGGAVLLGIGAYNAGVSQGLIESGRVTPGVAPGVYPVGPYIGGWGYGWGHGFGFFGFFGTLLFVFLLIGLVRAAFGRGRSWGPGGPRGWDGNHGRWNRDAWDDRVRQVHDELHQTASGLESTADRDRSTGDRPTG